MANPDADGNYTVRTTMNPEKELLVGQAEYTDLDRMGVLVKDDAEDDAPKEVSTTKLSGSQSAAPSGAPKTESV